ncbi:hypothetical protein [Allorhizocola rhizosphaerae]|uniref:hypothetical protein n=1 Tax=Allorhizocola rhizosphaerae TaxID=1872709 RepID=UPI000E3D4B44|nr:hypothetical protein [Allorhizocola rhizosphaerae]
MTWRLFALERYDDTSGSPEPPALLSTVDACLVAVVYLPADEVVLALVEGPDAEAVSAAAATAAGWRVDRLNPAQWLS